MRLDSNVVLFLAIMPKNLIAPGLKVDLILFLHCGISLNKTFTQGLVRISERMELRSAFRTDFVSTC